MARTTSANSNHLTLGTAAILSPSAVSISCWANFNALSGFQSLVARRGTGNASIYNLGMNTTHVFYDINASGSPPTGSATLVTGTWYNIVVTYDGTNGLNGFVNGVADGSRAQNGVLSGDTTQNAFIFADPSNGVGSACALADVGMWNLKLTAQEALSLAKGVRPYNIRPAALIGYWPIDGLQSPEPDLSGNANNGTIVGTLTPAFGPPFTQFTPRWPQPSLPPQPLPPIGFANLPNVVRQSRIITAM